MIKALSHLLYAIGLKPVPVPLSRGQSAPLSGEAHNGRTERAHDTASGEIRGEPAMDGMPAHAVQRTPPVAASPGLPPVDPVEGGVAQTDTSITPSDHTETELAGAGPAAMGAGGQEFSLAEVDKNVAPQWSANPWPNPSPLQTEDMPQNSNLRGDTTAEDDARGNVASYLPIGLFLRTSEGYEHSGAGEDKERLHDSSHTEVEGGTDTVEAGREQAWPRTLGFDSRSQDAPPCASKQAGSSKRVPPRIADRPRSEEWTDDELLTLPEAAALFWPGGPITTNTLRTAGRDGTLAITKVAGKFFTTPMAIRRMGLDEAAAMKPSVRKAVEVPPETMFQMKLAEAKRLGRERSRPRRAAKRSVAPTVNSKVGQ